MGEEKEERAWNCLIGQQTQNGLARPSRLKSITAEEISVDIMTKQNLIIYNHDRRKYRSDEEEISSGCMHTHIQAKSSISKSPETS